jgi:hypothetical protein
MNREGAETYLRVLAEAEMRGPMLPAPLPSWPGGPRGTARMAAVAEALTAVSALDAATAADIMADFDLAAAVRQDPGRPGPAAGGWTSWTSSAGPRLARYRSAGTGPMIPAGPLARSWPRPDPLAAASFVAASTGPRSPRPEGPDQPDFHGPDRFSPVGRPVPFRAEGTSGEIFLLSYAHTAAGARFTMVWRILGPHQTPVTQPGLLFGLLTVTDDRGARYALDFTSSSGPDWTGQLSLGPAPPAGIRWLDIAGPGEAAVRVSLEAGNGASTGPETTDRTVSPGEHLLTRLAERLLVIAAEFPADVRPRLAAPSLGPFDSLATGLGDVIAALAAAEVLPPLSPVPGQLAALCASLRISGHGISVPPAAELPEPWVSLLAHYQRRKPDPALPRDGHAAVAAALPELDGVRLALLDLHNFDGASFLEVLAKGLTPEEHHGPFGFDLYFPLSVWVRDSGGRWHATRPSGWHRTDGEYALRLQLLPPLPRSAEWIEVQAAGQAAQVRARLPLRWGAGR